MHESEEHAALVELFRHHPELAVWLLHRAGGVRLPDGYTVTVADPVHRGPHFAAADALILVRDANNVTRLAIIVEIQRGVDHEKDYRWPLYGYAERDRQRCDTRVLVIATRKEVASWARGLRRGPDDAMQIIVYGEEEVPRITDIAAARAFPALAVLSAALHGKSADGLPVTRAATAALGCLPPLQRRRYSSLVFHKLSKTDIHEDIMQQYQEPPDEPGYGVGAREYWEEVDARAEARLQARILLRQLEKRGLVVDAGTRDRVLACKDRALLDEWLDRVLTVSSAAELFAP